MTGSTPALVVVFGVETPLRVYSTASTEGEQLRLEDDLRNRSEGVRELLERVFELIEEDAA